MGLSRAAVRPEAWYATYRRGSWPRWRQPQAQPTTRVVRRPWQQCRPIQPTANGDQYRHPALRRRQPLQPTGFCGRRRRNYSPAGPGVATTARRATGAQRLNNRRTIVTLGGTGLSPGFRRALLLNPPMLSFRRLNVAAREPAPGSPRYCFPEITLPAQDGSGPLASTRSGPRRRLRNSYPTISHRLLAPDIQHWATALSDKDPNPPV